MNPNEPVAEAPPDDHHLAGDSPAYTATVDRPAEVLPEPVSMRRRFVRRFRRQPSAMVALGFLVVLTLVAVLAPLLAPQDPEAQNLRAVLAPAGDGHLLGTDDLGRDLFSRLVHGSRLSLGTAAVAASAVLVVGVAVGLASGLGGRWVDTVCMRTVDGLLAFPSLVLVLAIAGTIDGGLPSIVIGLAAVAWAPYARLVRGLVLQVRARPFVEAARAAGAPPLRLAVRHVLPAVIGPVVVLLATEMGGFVLAVSGLSFLGFGAPPPAPEWGTMLSEARVFLQSHPALVILPGAAVSLVTLGFTLLGEGLRDVLDPHTRREVAAIRRRAVSA